MATDQPSVTRNQPGVTRKDFLRGVGAAGAGGLVVGGVAGFFGGRASESTESLSKLPNRVRSEGIWVRAAHLPLA